MCTCTLGGAVVYVGRKTNIGVRENSVLKVVKTSVCDLT